MLDALRHHKATSRDRDGAPDRGAAGQNVPAPLAQAFGQAPPEEGAVTGKRLWLALVLVAVTALLVWQVAAMNGLLPAGPLSRLLRPGAAERTQSSPAPRSPSQSTRPPSQHAAPATAAVLPEPPPAQTPDPAEAPSDIPAEPGEQGRAGRAARHPARGGRPPRASPDPAPGRRTLSRCGRGREERAPDRRPRHPDRQGRRIISSSRSTTSASATSRMP